QLGQKRRSQMWRALPLCPRKRRESGHCRPDVKCQLLTKWLRLRAESKPAPEYAPRHGGQMVRHDSNTTERASDGYVPLPGMKQPTRHSPSSFHGHTTAWLSMFRWLTIDWGGTGIQCPSIRTRYPRPSNSQSGSSSLTPSVSSQHMIPYWFVRLRNQSLYGECA